MWVNIHSMPIRLLDKKWKTTNETKSRDAKGAEKRRENLVWQTLRPLRLCVFPRLASNRIGTIHSFTFSSGTSARLI
jgi:hypothetical protein